jgi:hypothetical protein
MTSMESTSFKNTVAGVWLLAVSGFALFFPVTTVVGWLTIISLAVIAPALIVRAWRPRAETLSESIQAETRQSSTP